MRDVLLEIGCEEIPSRFLSMALDDLRSEGRRRFEQAGLSFADAWVGGTPRRLALVMKGVSPKSKDSEREFLGPGVAQAKSSDGHWTPAALGFARAQGTTPEALIVRETERGPRLAFVKTTPGAATQKILPGLLPDIIRSLSFPKSMVWEESRMAFARPLRWVVALWGSTPVPFMVGGVKSGRRTMGLRFHSRSPLDVPSPDRYQSILKNHCVIVDPAERRRLIVQQMEHVAKGHGGFVALDNETALLDEVVHLVEHPVAVVGRFDPRFLEVPREVLVTSMKKHQKYFPVYKNSDGEELLPCFVAVRNGLSDNQHAVREGFERVLAARLSDAAFFFSEHTKRRLADRVADLTGIAFLAPTLSMKDKTDRVVALATELGRGLWGDSSPALAQAQRAALLSKADLTTGLVGEFPELQGVVGRLYAQRDGEPEVVARAVEEHHWPLTAEGPLPTSDVAALVSLADKADTLAGNFLLGQIPSGSQDPYGLRRTAVGVLRTLESRRWPVELPSLVGRALALLPPGLGDHDKAARLLTEFFHQRWAGLAEGRGHRSDEIEAVTASGPKDVHDAWARLVAMGEVRRHPDFGPLSTAFKRAAHLLKQAEKKGEFSPGTVRTDVFKTEAERSLHARAEELSNSIAPRLERRDYAHALAELVSLRGPVDDFFQKVVVMDPDVDVRGNRLRLLDEVRSLFARVADFSKIQDV